MPFPKELANAQGEALHAELIAKYAELREIHLNLQEPPHLFNLTARDAGTIRGLVAEAMDALAKAEKVAWPR